MVCLKQDGTYNYSWAEEPGSATEETLMLPAEFGAKAIRNLPYRLQRPRRHSHIFLSYRHEDTVGYTGRLHEDLARIFGAMNVFKDSSSIPPGAPFPKYSRASSSVYVRALAATPGLAFTSRGDDSSASVHSRCT